MSEEIPAQDRSGVVTAISLDAQLLAQDLGELLESPRWHPERQRISFVDIPTGRVFEVTPGSCEVLEHHTGIHPLGAALPWMNGYLLVGSEGVWEWSPGNPPKLWAEIPQEPGIISNDAFLRDGTVWVGRTDIHEKPGAGSLWRISPGVAELVADGLTMPNGMVSSQDRGGVIFAESAAKKIFNIPEDAHNLDLNSLDLYLDPSPWIPDGLARDHLGLLWVARWGEGVVTRVATASHPQLDVHVPTLQTTAIAFDPLGTMYITTAREHFNAEQRLADPLAGSIFSVSIYGRAGK